MRRYGVLILYNFFFFLVVVLLNNHLLHNCFFEESKTCSVYANRRYSGVEIVAAVAGLVVTVFSPQINIYKLLSSSSLHQSHMQLHAYISTVKRPKIFAVRWLGVSWERRRT